MAWVIEGRRPLPSCRTPSSPLFAATLAIAAVSLAIAVAFALAGAWLVLPFAGLELAGLALAIRHCGRSARKAVAVPPQPTFCTARMAARRSRPVPATRIRMINLRRKPF